MVLVIMDFQQINVNKYAEILNSFHYKMVTVQQDNVFVIMNYLVQQNMDLRVVD